MRRGSRRFKIQHTADPEINLTPLIDVVFVILIIFIVIAPMLELDQIELANASQNPQETTISVKDSGPITIHVHPDDTIYLNDQAIELIQLTHLLRLEKRKHPNATPQIFHDRRAHFGTYQAIKNAAELAGYDQMDVILKPA